MQSGIIRKGEIESKNVNRGKRQRDTDYDGVE